MAVFQINLKNVDVSVQDQVLTQFQFSDNVKNSKMWKDGSAKATVAKNIRKTRIIKEKIEKQKAARNSRESDI